MQYNISSKFQSLAKKENSYLGKLAFQKMSVQDYMNDYKEGNPAVYVGTYSKYNDSAVIMTHSWRYATIFTLMKRILS